jgi:hypothetical protein
MKKMSYYLLAIAVLAAGFVACHKDNNSDDNENNEGNNIEINIITMTAASSDMKFELIGTGYLTIDWGDHTQPEKFRLFNDTSIYRHLYSAGEEHSITITIKGKITHLNSNFCDSTGCYTTPLTSSDVSKCTSLQYLSCPSGYLATLDVSKCTLLKSLNCAFNQLTTLNVSKCTKLQDIWCAYNNLETLDVSDCIALQHLNCQLNELSATALNDLFGTLHNNFYDRKEIYITANPGTQNHECDCTIAINKGWRVFH